MVGNAPRFLTYQVGASVLHRLDPRTKLLAAAFIAADALIASVPRGMVAAYVLGVVAGLAARQFLPALWRLVRPLLVFLVLFGLLVVVTTPGHALAHIWIVVPTRDGLDLAIRLGLQVLLIACTSSLLTLTTPPLAVADGLQWMFGWLERVKFPVREIVAMVVIGLTFVPLLVEEAQKVISAQRARGADLSMNALLDEESMGALLIPLLLANLRRGGELAESMEARLYDTGVRTALHQRQFYQLDAVVAGIMAIGTALVVWLSFF